MSQDLKSLVCAGDLTAAVKALKGQHAIVVDYQVERATTSVQGFTSLMLRVIARVKSSPGDTTTSSCSVIVKRLPVMAAQLEMMSDNDMFEREIAFFNQAVPILEQKMDNSPLVKCFLAHGTTLVLEDLCASGYFTLGKSMKDVGQDILKLSHIRLVMRKLAQIHAASLDVDWMALMPQHLEKDSMFEGKAGDTFKNMVQSGCKTTVIIMKELYPEKYKKYADWLLSDNCFEIMTKLSKPDPKFLNVLSHGDCWVNNLMFKLDSEKKPLDVKLLDLQIFRFAPASRDILYFLYSCTTREYRVQNEKEILRTYVDAFNTFVCETPDRITLATFTEEYERSRLFGVTLAVAMRPMLFMEGLFPGENEEMSKDQFESIMFGDQSGDTLRQFRENEDFRVSMREVVGEVMDELEKQGIV